MVWELRFTVEFDDEGAVHYCACAYEEGRAVCGWSAPALSELFPLIEASAQSWRRRAMTSNLAPRHGAPSAASP